RLPPHAPAPGRPAPDPAPPPAPPGVIMGRAPAVDTPVLRSPPEVGSGQGIPQHTGEATYPCSLPGLGGLVVSRCVGPSLHRLSAWLSPTREHLGREFDPARADCGYRAPLPPRLARPRPIVRPARAGTSESVGGEGGI